MISWFGIINLFCLQPCQDMPLIKLGSFIFIMNKNSVIYLFTQTLQRRTKTEGKKEESNISGLSFRFLLQSTQSNIINIHMFGQMLGHCCFVHGITKLISLINNTVVPSSESLWLRLCLSLTIDIWKCLWKLGHCVVGCSHMADHMFPTPATTLRLSPECDAF